MPHFFSWDRGLGVLAGLLIAALGAVVTTQNLGLIHDPLAQSQKKLAQKAQQQELNDQLMRAATEGDLIVVSGLVEKGAMIDTKDSYGWTPLIQASMMNHFDVVKYLVVKGADVNAQAVDGTNPLQNAIIFDHVAMVKFLLARGASLDAAGKYGWNSIETARKRGRRKVLNYLEHEDHIKDASH